MKHRILLFLVATPLVLFILLVLLLALVASDPSSAASKAMVIVLTKALKGRCVMDEMCGFMA